MHTVIVTGAAGFAGCNLTEKLIEQGYNVIALLRPGSEHNKRLMPLMDTKRLYPVELDISDVPALPARIRELSLKPDTFFHLAWSGSRDDFAAQYKNIGDTVMAVEAAEASGCYRFICTGSQAEYGITDKIQTEDMAPAPLNAYGAAKAAAMYLSKRRTEQLSLEWIWGRIFSLYGKYEPEHTLIQYLWKAFKNSEEVHVTPAEQNWDYLDASDAAEALISLGEKGRDSEIYNIANGGYRPLKEFIEELGEIYVGEAREVGTVGVGLHNSGGANSSENGQTITAASSIITFPTIHYDKTAEAIVSLQPSIDKIKRDTGWSPKTPFGKFFISEG